MWALSGIYFLTNKINFFLFQLNSANSVSNLESEYLEAETGNVKNIRATSIECNQKGPKTIGMESASNKRMRSANINTWTLRFNEQSLETKVILIE